MHSLFVGFIFEKLVGAQGHPLQKRHCFILPRTHIEESYPGHFLFVEEELDLVARPPALLSPLIRILLLRNKLNQYPVVQPVKRDHLQLLLALLTNELHLGAGKESVRESFQGLREEDQVIASLEPGLGNDFRMHLFS